MTKWYLRILRAAAAFDIRLRCLTHGVDLRAPPIRLAGTRSPGSWRMCAVLLKYNAILNHDQTSLHGHACTRRQCPCALLRVAEVWGRAAAWKTWVEASLCFAPSAPSSRSRSPPGLEFPVLAQYEYTQQSEIHRCRFHLLMCKVVCSWRREPYMIYAHIFVYVTKHKLK